MRTILMGIGIAIILIGLLWIGQGTGVIRWPASSFMIDQSPWATRGYAMAVLGVAMVLAARRFRR
jgi:hypothetical protein